jgi:hypothetical protein
VPPQWAVKLMNRATADNQSAQAEDEGLEPTKEWVKDLCDEIIAEEFASPDLELTWLDEDDGTAANEAALEGRVKLGALTLNEMRDALGLDPYTNAAADRPMVLTATGYVPIEANAGADTNSAANGAEPATPPSTAPVVKSYNPDQPRVPAGNPDAGQWTNEDGTSGSNDPRVVSDATPDNTWIPGAQYAAGSEDDENESRADGRQFEGTPAQLMRQEIAVREYRSVLSQVLRLDPTWKPSPSLVDPNDIEGDIAKFEADTKEAEQHLARLQALGFARDPDTGEVVPATEPKTGNPRIDSTTQILMDTFRKVMGQIGPRPDLAAGQYGTLVHTQCANAIRAMNLPGIDTNDVERTFSVDDDDSYGAKDSIRPDVILRDDDGSIIAIYDFKTGRGLPEDRVIRFRYMTESGRTVPVIELSRSRGALSKCQEADRKVSFRGSASERR